MDSVWEAFYIYIGAAMFYMDNVQGLGLKNKQRVYYREWQGLARNWGDQNDTPHPSTQAERIEDIQPSDEQIHEVGTRLAQMAVKLASTYHGPHLEMARMAYLWRGMHATRVDDLTPFFRFLLTKESPLI